VVDDDADCRRSVRARLTAIGYAVVDADTPSAAAGLIRDSVPDLVLCDVYFREGSGFDVLHDLRTHEATETVPLILMTGSGDDAVMRRGMEFGADDYLRKPFTAGELAAAVSARLGTQDRLKAAAARAAHESEARFRAVAVAALDAVVVLDQDGAISFWSPAAEHVFGFSASEAFGTRFHELLGTDPFPLPRPPAAQEAQRGSPAGGGGEALELRARHKRGTELTVEVSLAAVPLQGHWHAVGILRDVTAEREAHQARQREQILLRTLVDTLPDCIYAKDREGRKTLSNLADQRSIGAGREEDVLGKTDHELLDGRVADACHADDMRVLAAGEAIRDRQELIVNTRGERRWLETTKVPLRDAAGTIVGLVGIGHDITHRRHIEEQLRKLSKAVEQSPASVVITDTSGRIEYVNPRFCAVTGYTAEEVVGLNPRVLQSGESAPELYEQLWATICRGGEWRGEFHNRKKNGELFWELAVVSAITDDHGAISHFIAVKEDITERKRTERERHLMELQLRQAQKLEAIGQLAAGITHEINTPMQYIGDNTRYLQASFEELIEGLATCRELVAALCTRNEVSELLAPVRAAFEALDFDYLREEIPRAVSASLDGVREVSRIVLAMKEFCHPGCVEKTAVDLGRSIENAVTVARNEYKYVADVHTEIAADLPPVLCIPGELNQVLLNLIVNAAHAIGDALAATPGARGRITIAARRDGDWIDLRVADTGTGIPDAVRDRVFEPFFTTKPLGKGSGQGLALARSVIVHKHGGEITFESEVGTGTTFVIRLPLGAGPDRES
jgi:PAS domain S-box-containing protein